MADQILDALEPAFAEWGLLIVFFLAMLESGFVVASFVPGESVLLLGGFFASPFRGGDETVLALPAVIAVGFAGALAGDLIGYAVGRVAGVAFVRRFGRYVFLPERRLPLLQEYIHVYGVRAIFLGRFAPFLRSVRTLVAGTVRMPFGRFLLADVAGAAVWVTAIVLTGYAVGESWQAARRYLGASAFVIFGLLMLAFWVTWRSMRRRFERELEIKLGGRPLASEAEPPGAGRPL